LCQRDPKGFTLIELMIVVVVIGILAAIAIPNFLNMKYRAQEASVRKNAHVTRLAAEDFSVQNDGVYAATLASALPTGETMIDLLPDGALLINPFSNVADSPINGIAANTGVIGYLSIDSNADGSPDGYSISGFGASALIVTYTNGI
jgi:prepilin-type N-terminal cleavage/methylation domain-containing protein